ncbi:DUF3553 domain-containing protein [Aliiroseovarius sp. F20344]|uniref:DUF3553 domain-containing protein n=1 Tax=Aliiroseovarius sp. F20344 TaxID=2926414 RepID=UPI001FF633DE|nr:DUF3553 domain-containing protein [Aliiroseovarius sp. F20344]MCK0143698.1 DUF3553 domain-containing protein [Aliiroseovarius sp. F20344]
MGLGSLLEPGMLVRHPQKPDWGLGQVQSNIGGRVTVNFEHAGKQVIMIELIDLIPVFDLSDPS